LVTSSLHTFSPSWVNFGEVKLDQNVLTISLELTKEQKSAHIMPVEYRLIRWDKWRILVPKDQLLDFAYAVHSGSESQIWNYFIKTDTTDGSRKGLPDLPPEFLRYMTIPPSKLALPPLKL
jgi:hypothetical protein